MFDGMKKGTRAGVEEGRRRKRLGCCLSRIDLGKEQRCWLDGQASSRVWVEGKAADMKSGQIPAARVGRTHDN